MAAAMIVTSFPFLAKADTNLWPLAWFGLIPLLYVLERSTSRSGFWYGWFTGFAVNFGGFWWVSHVLENFGQMPSYVAWPVAALNGAYQGLSYGVFGYFLCRLRPAEGKSSVFRVAMIFTVIEFIFPLLFPWYLGNSQYRFLLAIQIADITGVMGITFTIVLFNAAVYEALSARIYRQPPRWRMVGIAAAIVATVFIYGGVRLAQVEQTMSEAKTIKLGLVEANIGIFQEERAKHPNVPGHVLSHSHLLRHHHLSRELEKKKVDLVVWPESSYLPVGYMHIKRQPDFAVAVSSSGKVATWRDHPGSEPSWAMLNAVEGGALRAVAAIREDAFAAVGDQGRVLVGDGTSLRQLSASGQSRLHGVALSPVREVAANADKQGFVVWAVGEKGTLLGPQLDRGDKGVTLKPNTGRLDRMTSEDGQWTHETLRAIAMVSALDGWAVGDKGTLVWIEKGRPRLHPTGIKDDLHGIWWSRKGVWIAASGGRVYSMTRDRRLVPENTGVTGTLRAITGYRDLVYAVGDDGSVLRRDTRGVWKPMGKRLPHPLRSIAVEPRGTVMVTDEKGGLWRYDGVDWEATPVPGLGPVTGLAPLPYVRTTPMPHDAKYVLQSPALPSDEKAFLSNPHIEFRKWTDVDLNAVQRGFTTPIIYGGLTWAPSPDVNADRLLKFNTAVMLDEEGRVLGTYDKNYLLMFGEYIPLGDTFPSLYDVFPSGRFDAGTDVEVFEWRGFKIGVMVCYEDLLPKFTRRLADKDPNIIINVTNDAWFGRNSEPYLHLALASLRAVENRVVLVRSTNTGVSAFIMPTGELTQQSDLHSDEILVEKVPMMPGGTIYGMIGDGFTYLLLVWFVILWLAAVRRKRAMSSADTSSKED
jgi:apolipoprotein N-acyltransferase